VKKKEIHSMYKDVEPLLDNREAFLWYKIPLKFRDEVRRNIIAGDLTSVFFSDKGEVIMDRNSSQEMKRLGHKRVNLAKSLFSDLFE